jgi:5-oxoprolinase (ATP-hydrolysing)
MTNTRITDPEIFESRYPVLLTSFRIRKGSGGSGKFRGGDGVVRSFLFLEPMTVSVLSERRVLPPRGIVGGGCGLRGLNILRTPRETEPKSFSSVAKMLESFSGEWVFPRGYRERNVGGKALLKTKAGYILEINTPGGGGYGACC